jgi:hypothetical protein
MSLRREKDQATDFLFVGAFKKQQQQKSKHPHKRDKE